MRVLLLANRFEPSIGGIERQSMFMAKAFKHRGIDVAIVTDRYSSSLPRFEEIDGIPVHRVWSLYTIRKPFDGIMKLLKGGEFSGGSGIPKNEDVAIHRSRKRTLKSRLNRLFSYRIPLYSLFVSCLIALYRRRNEYDIIQVFQTNLLAVAAVLVGRFAGKPVVACDAVYAGMEELKEFLFWRRTTSLLRKYCIFTALSCQIEQDLLERGIASNRIVRIPIAVEMPETLSQKVVPAASVLFVGNVVGDLRQKGLDILLKAWKLVIQEKSKAVLSVVGGGNFTSFQLLADSLGLGESVHFVGARKNIGEWYESNRIFVLPSRYEGMSNALVEAMSHARACVVTEISGSDELIDHRTNGLKVPPEDPEALAQAIVFLMKNPTKAKQFGKRARRTVSTVNNPDLIADTYVSLYLSLLKGSRRQ